MRRVLLTILVVAALGASGCGGGSSSSDTTSSSKTDTTASKENASTAKTETTSSEKSEAEAPTHPAPLWLGGRTVPNRREAKVHVKPSGLAGSEPKPYIPNAHPANRVAMKDLLDGIGTYFATGEQITVQYVGYDYKTGKIFASSWDKGRPVTFKLGAGEVIPAWEEALASTEVGDRRVMVVPPKLAKGSYPPNIPKGKTVVFIVEPLPPSSAKKAEKPPKPKPKAAKKAGKGAKKVAKGAAGTKKTKPKVVPPKGPKPKNLVVKDLEVGTGPEAKAGDKLTVQYVGVGYESGTEFDSSWGKKPFTFTLGEGNLIKGWEEGLEGMKVGGRRELITPPDYAYGSEGSGKIAPNATLVFVIDLLEVK